MSFYKGSEGDYTIKSGDSLSRIAKDAGVSIGQLQSWNNITDPNKISAGAKLYTYDYRATPTVATPTVATPTVEAASEPSIVNVINGNKTINKGDVYKTGAGEDSTLPQATDRMKEAGIEYDWSKEGRIQGYLEEQMKIEEARRQAIEDKSKINYAQESHDANKLKIVAHQNQNKMGITGYAAKDQDRKVLVAQNARTLALYSQEEMIKAGFDSGVRRAALYGDLKERQVTAEEYAKKVEQAYTDAQITGVYFDPIQMQLLGQKKMAQSMMNNPYASQSDRDRATTVDKGLTNAFLELGITEKGADTIDKIYQKENLELQKAANSIASQANSITATTNALMANGQVDATLKDYAARGISPTDQELEALNKKWGTDLSIDEMRKDYNKYAYGKEPEKTTSDGPYKVKEPVSIFDTKNPPVWGYKKK